MSFMASIDTNCMTLVRYILHEQRKHPTATGDFTTLLTHLLTAIKAISNAVRKAGIANLFGISGSTNVQGEVVKKLDVLSNDLFINMLKASYTVCGLISEENEEMICIDIDKRGKYFLCFDPLDGSSNIDCLGSIGSIFAIYKYDGDLKAPINEENLLQPGRKMIGAGYALYGSATMVVLTVGNGVHGFTLDPSIGEFVLTEPNMVIPSRGKIYSINEGYTKMWDAKVKKYVDSKKYPPNNGKPYAARYIGSMVADVHRTLVYGGIFIYPATTDSPNGKLRLMYEGNPMGMIIEQAGGLASNGKEPILDVMPKSLHERQPVFLGSKDDVNEILAILNDP